MTHSTEPRPYRAYTRKDIDSIPQLRSWSHAARTEMKALASVLPFRVNTYVVDEVIDWRRVPDDPIFQLTFPQRGMLEATELARMVALIERGADAREIETAARAIQLGLNPHPAGQRELNVPSDGEAAMAGTQHKYRETVLFFPSQGQTCHAYCTYCFRWAQFVGIEGMKFASRETERLVSYIERHPDVESVLITGGDPLIMKTSILEAYIEPLLALEQLVSIRIGTKALAYWPQRFVTDADADALARLFERVRARGKTLALMAHYSHPVELETPIAERALARAIDAGAVVRCQAPVVKHVNDDASVWAAMWRRQVRLGAVPYYMFVERDTGARRYFEVPLSRAFEIFRDAYAQCSGLERTVRGPSMSATPGKVAIQGVSEIRGEPVFCLSFLQARDPDWVGRPFFARFDEDAVWLDDLRPAQGARAFFFERPMRELARTRIPFWRRGRDDEDAASA